MNELLLRARYDGFTLDLAVEWSGPVLTLFGPSGSGKSTALEAIAGLRTEVAGRIVLGGRVLLDSARAIRLPPQARRVGWVPQDAALFPHLDVAHNVRFGAPRAADPGRMALALDVLGLEPLLERRVTGLSGGERQRVALARALVSGADVLLLDEPLASLDTGLRATALRFLQRLRDDVRVPMIHVTHDPREAHALGGIVALIRAGQRIDIGPPADVFARAQGLSLLEALGAENRFEVRASDAGRVRTAGGVELVVGTPVGDHVAVRAEDLLVATGALSGISARNQLRGTVIALEPLDAFVYVRIQVAGDVWVTRVTSASAAELALVPGRIVWLILKASAIHGV